MCGVSWRGDNFQSSRVFVGVAIVVVEKENKIGRVREREREWILKKTQVSTNNTTSQESEPILAKVSNSGFLIVNLQYYSLMKLQI